MWPARRPIKQTTAGFSHSRQGHPNPDQDMWAHPVVRDLGTTVSRISGLHLVLTLSTKCVPSRCSANRLARGLAHQISNKSRTAL